MGKLSEARKSYSACAGNWGLSKAEISMLKETLRVYLIKILKQGEILVHQGCPESMWQPPVKSTTFKYFIYFERIKKSDMYHLTIIQRFEKKEG